MSSYDFLVSKTWTDESASAATGAIITMFGAKGGIGRTTISANLATALVQKTNQSVAIVDLDTRFGDVSTLLDISVERSIADLPLPEEEINWEMLKDCLYTHDTGVTILPAPVRPTDWRNVNAGRIERVVTLLAQKYDYVILDTPGTFNDIVARALELATLVLLVTTMDITSLKNTLLAIDMLRSWDFPQDKVKLLINATNEASNVQPEEVKRMLGREVFWSIPYDRNISTATQLGMPVVVAKPTSKASESMVELARLLVEHIGAAFRTAVPLAPGEEAANAPQAEQQAQQSTDRSDSGGPLEDLAVAVAAAALEATETIDRAWCDATGEVQSPQSNFFVRMETVFFVLHVVNRTSFAIGGDRHRTVIQDAIAKLVVSSVVTSSFNTSTAKPGFGAKEWEQRMISESIEALNEAEFEYGSCKELFGEPSADGGLLDESCAVGRFTARIEEAAEQQANSGLRFTIGTSIIDAMQHANLIELVKASAGTIPPQQKHQTTSVRRLLRWMGEKVG